MLDQWKLFNFSFIIIWTRDVFENLFSQFLLVASSFWNFSLLISYFWFLKFWVCCFIEITLITLFWLLFVLQIIFKFRNKVALFVFWSNCTIDILWLVAFLFMSLFIALNPWIVLCSFCSWLLNPLWFFLFWFILRKFLFVIEMLLNFSSLPF